MQAASATTCVCLASAEDGEAPVPWPDGAPPTPHRWFWATDAAAVAGCSVGLITHEVPAELLRLGCVTVQRGHPHVDVNRFAVAKMLAMTGDPPCGSSPVCTVARGLLARANEAQRAIDASRRRM